MPAIPPSQIRIPEVTQAKIADLKVRWGGISPATRTDVVIRSIDIAHAAEFDAKKKPKSAKA
ncbi:MAG: hypothetical protein P4L67_04505 [Candidatus Pacebacteria bacterium]|nr:hypothetical protein [Candidatus Paceibacterota bacterium]